MPYLDNIKVEVKGYKDNVIVQTLNYFKVRSSTARALLEQAGHNSLVITLTNNGSDIITNSKNDVRGDWQCSKQDQQELTESLLFEIKNSVNTDKANVFQRQHQLGQISDLEFGTQKALIESESSVAVSEILNEVKGLYVPSEWGDKQLQAVALGSTRPGGFALYFANDKHDASDTSTKMGMKSKYLYAYELIDRFPGATIPKCINKFRTCTTEIWTPRRIDIMTHPLALKRSDFFKALDKLFSEPKGPQKVRQALACYILGLRFLVERRGWFVRWKGNPAIDYYEFATEIRRIDNLTRENGEEVARLFRNYFE